MSRDEIHKRTISNVKKILSKGGSLGGSFYFVSNAKGTDAVVVVHVVRKAADAKKAAKEGKSFRKEIKGAKYCSGSVTALKKKLVFHIEVGTAPTTLMKSAFTKLAKADAGLGLLKKAKYQKGLEVEEAEDTSVIAEGEITLTAEEQKELDAVLGDEEGLSASNKAILDAMAEEELDELQEEIDNSTAAIAALEAAFDGSEAKAFELHSARLELAAQLEEGADSFAGAEIPSSMKESFNAALSESLAPMFRKYQTLSSERASAIAEYNTITARLEHAKEISEDDIVRLGELVTIEEQCNRGIEAYEQSIDQALAIMNIQ